MRSYPIISVIARAEYNQDTGQPEPLVRIKVQGGDLIKVWLKHLGGIRDLPFHRLGELVGCTLVETESHGSAVEIDGYFVVHRFKEYYVADWDSGRKPKGSALRNLGSGAPSHKRDDEIDWAKYDDSLDSDQQGPGFWNQF